MKITTSRPTWISADAVFSTAQIQAQEFVQVPSGSQPGPPINVGGGTSRPPSAPSGEDQKLPGAAPDDGSEAAQIES